MLHQKETLQGVVRNIIKANYIPEQAVRTEEIKRYYSSKFEELSGTELVSNAGYT